MRAATRRDLRLLADTRAWTALAPNAAWRGAIRRGCRRCWPRTPRWRRADRQRQKSPPRFSGGFFSLRAGMPGAVVAQVGAAGRVVRPEALCARLIVAIAAVCRNGGVARRRGVGVIIAVVVGIGPVTISAAVIIRRRQRATDNGTGGEAQPQSHAAAVPAAMPTAMPAS